MSDLYWDNLGHGLDNELLSDVTSSDARSNDTPCEAVSDHAPSDSNDSYLISDSKESDWEQEQAQLQTLVVYRLHSRGSKKRQRQNDTPQQGLRCLQPLTKSARSTLELLRFPFKPKRACPFKKMRKSDWTHFLEQIRARAPSQQWFAQWQRVLEDICQNQVVNVRFVVCVSNAGTRQIYIHSGDLYQATMRATGNCGHSGTKKINQFSLRDQLELKKHFSHDDTWLTSWEKIRDESDAIKKRNSEFFQDFLPNVAAVLNIRS
jgi:hypothetical protein